jgi:hypothetical protein
MVSSRGSSWGTASILREQSFLRCPLEQHREGVPVAFLADFLLELLPAPPGAVIEHDRQREARRGGRGGRGGAAIPTWT